MAFNLPKKEAPKKHKKYFLSYPDGTNKKYVGDLVEKCGPNDEKLLVGQVVIARCMDSELMEDIRLDITGVMLTIKG